MTLQPIKADLLRRVRHGFFTRQGGVSNGIYASLNGGQGSRDSAAAVTENRARIAAHLGATEIMTVSQIHSATAHLVSAPWSGGVPDGDAMVTATPDLAIAVLVADCTPVLFHDPKNGVIGAAHAGWKGAVGGILEATLDTMVAAGAERGEILAALGPVISQRAYEVGPEFVEQFLDDDPANERFFAGGQGDRAHFDLPGFVLNRLREAGVRQAEWTGHCTFSDPERFFSYRRATHAGEPDYGRLVAAIVLG
ncbi:MAG: peptidoglycan editing factor PgeF [Pseudomonadota bacterium]